MLIAVLFYAVRHIDKHHFSDLLSDLVLNVYDSSFGGMRLQSDGLRVSQLLFLALSCFHVSVNVGGPDLSLVTGQRRFVRTLFSLLLLSVVNCEHTLELVDQMWEQCSLHVMLFCGVLPEQCHMQRKGSYCIVGRNGMICRYDDRSSMLSFTRHYTKVLCRNTTYL